MKTKKQIEDKLNLLEDLIINQEIQYELIMGIKQKAHIRMKINLLKWVLDNEHKETIN